MFGNKKIAILLGITTIIFTSNYSMAQNTVPSALPTIEQLPKIQVVPAGSDKYYNPANYNSGIEQSQNQKLQDVILRLESTKIDAQREYNEAQKKFNEVDIRYKKVKEERKQTKKQLKLINKRIKSIEATKNRIQRDILIQNQVINKPTL